MKAGIDKLVLTTTDFSVKDVHHPELQTAFVLNGQMPHLYTDQLGNVVFGQKTFYNAEEGLVSMTINRHGLQVITNPSKHYHSYELLTETERLADVGKRVERTLHQVGIKLNLQDAKVSRLDLTKQAFMPQPVPLYGEAFKCMNGKRQERKGYENGFYFSNKQHEVVFYDKGIAAKMPPNKNFMRGEVRYLRTKVVQKLTEGIVTFKDLQSSGADHITSCYNKYMQNQVFGQAQKAPNLDENMPNLLAMATFIKALRDAKPNGWTSEIKNMYGLEHMLDLVGGVEGYKKVLAMAGVPRTSMYNILKRDKELLRKKGFLDASIGNVTVASMINEVRTMFAA